MLLDFNLLAQKFSNIHLQVGLGSVKDGGWIVLGVKLKSYQFTSPRPSPPLGQKNK